MRTCTSCSKEFTMSAEERLLRAIFGQNNDKCNGCLCIEVGTSQKCTFCGITTKDPIFYDSKPFCSNSCIAANRGGLKPGGDVPTPERLTRMVIDNRRYYRDSKVIRDLNCPMCGTLTLYRGHRQYICPLCNYRFTDSRR